MKKKQSKSSREDESLGMRRGKESTKSQSYKSRRDESNASSKKSAKFTEKMPPSKKLVTKGGKQVSGINFSQALEKYNRKMGDKDNFPAKKPADISGALRRAKEGYSKKPRVKPSMMKGKSK